MPIPIPTTDTHMRSIVRMPRDDTPLAMTQYGQRFVLVNDYWELPVLTSRRETEPIVLSERDWDLITHEPEHEEELPESLNAAAQAYRDSVIYSHGFKRRSVD